MTKHTLYRVGSHNGVTVLLTEDAYQAFQETMAFLDKSGGSYEGIDPDLERRIAAGTMTFVRSERWYESGTHNRVIHTGNYDEHLDVIQRLHNVIRDESRTFSVPFSSGYYPDFQRELEKGYGPKPTLLDKLLGNTDTLTPVVGTVG